ncbi:MAG: hypothetical protein ACLP52_31855 [Streptosporangiaceae bacterium]
MLLLTVTAETQGQMRGDFCDAIEGELVVVFADCHVSAHEDDLGRCREGCPPRFFGLNSHQASTTALIRDVQISREDYLLALSAYAEHRGSPAPDSLACVLGTRMVDRAVVFLPGTVVGFAEGKLTARSEPRHSWRDLMTGAACIAKSFAWRRYYDKTIRAIDRAQGQP